MTDIRDLIAGARRHVEAGERLHADVFYRLILKDTTPPTTGPARVAHGEACAWFARAALARGRFGEAADWWREAIGADPLAVEYRLDLAMRCLLPMGLLRDARIEAERATRIEPAWPEAWRALGGIEHELGHAAATIAAYDRRLELAPDDPDAMLDRAHVALDLEDYDRVDDLCAEVMLTDRHGDAWHAVGMVAHRRGDHEAAVRRYTIAIDEGCRNPDLVRWNRSLSLHAMGRWREGWEDHEARGAQSVNPGLAMPMRRFSVPRLNREILKSTRSTLHLHQEQGMGDALALARYAPLLARLGHTVRLEVAEPLVSLLARSLPGVNVMPRALDYPGALGIPTFDYHVPMLSLPHLFETTVETVPWDGPYLTPDPALVAEYRKRVPPGAIGLCWSSGIREGVWIETYGRRKSMRLADMVPAMLRGRPTVSLQVGPERAELEKYPLTLDLLPAKPSWDETAALVACLDAVVTVDTGVSHLAGGMGIPVLLAMHRGGSWHYLADIEDTPWQHRSPWYPNTRVFRQSADDRWDDVMARLAGDIAAPARAEAAD